MAWQLGFAGAPDFGARILRALAASAHGVQVVYTQPDRPAGRGRRLTPCPVRATADALGIETRMPERFDARELRVLAALDCLVVAGYGVLLPEGVLAAPSLGCINVHASLLPRWRGAAPVERAILAGDAETGVSIMQIDSGLDTGAVYRRARLPLGADATGAGVAQRLAELGAEALLDVLAALPDIAPTAQDDALATYAPKLEAAERDLDWNRDARDLDRQVRALAGRLDACTAAPGGARISVLEAHPVAGAERLPGTLLRSPSGWCVACGRGALALRTVRLNRGRGTPLPIRSAVNGYGAIFFDGARFGAARGDRAH